jgi:hypothetical protein
LLYNLYSFSIDNITALLNSSLYRTGSRGKSWLTIVA